MRELFVYYRVVPASAVAAAAGVMRMQAELCAAYPGLRARLLRQPEDRDGRQTWMETYTSSNTEGITPALQAGIERAALALSASFDGPRHTEVFVPCA
jgi:hypothetical protein